MTRIMNMLIVSLVLLLSTGQVTAIAPAFAFGKLLQVIEIGLTLVDTYESVTSLLEPSNEDILNAIQELDGTLLEIQDQNNLVDCITATRDRSKTFADHVSSGLTIAVRTSMLAQVNDGSSTTAKFCMNRFNEVFMGRDSLLTSTDTMLKVHYDKHGDKNLPALWAAFTSLHASAFAQATWGIVESHKDTAEDSATTVAALKRTFDLQVKEHFDVAYPYMGCTKIKVGGTNGKELNCVKGEDTLFADPDDRRHEAFVVTVKYHILTATDDNFFLHMTPEAISSGDNSCEDDEFVLVESSGSVHPQLFESGNRAWCFYNPTTKRFMTFLWNSVVHCGAAQKSLSSPSEECKDSHAFIFRTDDKETEFKDACIIVNPLYEPHVERYHPGICDIFVDFAYEPIIKRVLPQSELDPIALFNPDDSTTTGGGSKTGTATSKSVARVTLFATFLAIQLIR